MCTGAPRRVAPPCTPRQSCLGCGEMGLTPMNHNNNKIIDNSSSNNSNNNSNHNSNANNDNTTNTRTNSNSNSNSNSNCKHYWGRCKSNEYCQTGDKRYALALLGDTRRLTGVPKRSLCQKT